MVEAIIGNVNHLSKSESLHYSCIFKAWGQTSMVYLILSDLIYDIARKYLSVNSYWWACSNINIFSRMESLQGGQKDYLPYKNVVIVRKMVFQQDRTIHILDNILLS